MPVLLIALTALVLATPALGADTFGDLNDVVLVRVYDGNTFFVDIPELHPLIGDEIGIRVRRVDTPEIRARCDAERDLAHAARRLAERVLIDAQSIDLMNIERGRYFCIVATVLVDRVDLAAILIADHTKFGSSFFYKVTDLVQVDTIITTKELERSDPSLVRAIRDPGVTLGSVERERRTSRAPSAPRRGRCGADIPLDRSTPSGSRRRAILFRNRVVESSSVADAPVVIRGCRQTRRR